MVVPDNCKLSKTVDQIRLVSKINIPINNIKWNYITWNWHPLSWMASYIFVNSLTLMNAKVTYPIKESVYSKIIKFISIKQTYTMHVYILEIWYEFLSCSLFFRHCVARSSERRSSIKCRPQGTPWQRHNSLQWTSVTICGTRHSSS